MGRSHPVHRLVGRLGLKYWLKGTAFHSECHQGRFHFFAIQFYARLLLPRFKKHFQFALESPPVVTISRQSADIDPQKTKSRRRKASYPRCKQPNSRLHHNGCQAHPVGDILPFLKVMHQY